MIFVKYISSCSLSYYKHFPIFCILISLTQFSHHLILGSSSVKHSESDREFLRKMRFLTLIYFFFFQFVLISKCLSISKIIK